MELKDIKEMFSYELWEILSTSQKNCLLDQVKEFPSDIIEKQVEAYEHLHYIQEDIKPLDKCDELSKEDGEIGFELIKNGQVGAIIVAGGVGTRLKMDSAIVETYTRSVRIECSLISYKSIVTQQNHSDFFGNTFPLVYVES